MLPKEKLEHLKSYLIGISGKKILKHELSSFIAMTKAIIIPYLINTKSYFLSLSNQHGLDVNDIAIEIMGDLFVQNEDGCPVNINSFINSLNENIIEISADKLFLAYQSFLKKISDVYISRAYAELDPTGFRIMRNIKDTLPTNFFALRKSIRGTEIYATNSVEYDKLPYVSFEALQYIFLSRVEKKLTTRNLLELLYNILMELECRKEILLNDAVLLFKEYYEMGLEAVKLEDDLIDNNRVLNDYEMKQLTGLVLNEIKGKILIDYYAKSKLTEKQALGLYEAIKDILHDFINHGKNNLSYYDYLKKYIDIDKSEYCLKYKSKIEYMIKLIKEKYRCYLFT